MQGFLVLRSCAQMIGLLTCTISSLVRIQGMAGGDFLGKEGCPQTEQGELTKGAFCWQRYISNAGFVLGNFLSLLLF